MTTTPPAAAGPVGGMALAELARLAMAEMEALGVLVVDERAPVPLLAASAGTLPLPGLGQLLSGERLRWTPGEVSEQTVVARRYRDCGVLSTPLATDADRVVGTMHVVHDGDLLPPLGDQRSLLCAFSRHVGFLLGSDDADRPPGRVETADNGPFPWDDAERLPKAIEEITPWVAEMVRPVIGAGSVGITVWDEDRGILRALPGAFGCADGASAASVTGPPTNLRSVAARVFATGRSYMTNCASGDPGILQPYVRLFEIRRMLSVPLAHGDRRVGVLHLANKPSDFTAEDVAVADAMAGRIAMAVELARSVSRMASGQRLEGVLAAAATAIASGRDVEECVIPALDELGAILGASVVALVPLSSGPLVRRLHPPSTELEHRLLADATIGRTSVGALPHRAGDPGWAALHAPVELYGERVATLSVLRRNGEPFGADEEGFVTRLASLVALAWATERYQRQLAGIARARERERIAEELHDRAAQILFAAQLGLDSLLEGDAEGLTDRQRILEVRDLLTDSDAAIREVINRQGAPRSPQLSRRLRLEVESVEAEFGVVVHVDLADDDALGAVPGAITEAMVRVAREGMTNAAKHAGPCRINLEVAPDGPGRLVLRVSDDGLGFGTSADRRRGVGLGSLQRTVEDAGGALTIQAATGASGTRLVATFGF